MNYEKRLLKELARYDGTGFTVTDFATFWKRSRTAVQAAAINLENDCKIVVDRMGVLSLKESPNVT